MKAKSENEIFEEIILQASKELLANKKDALLFGGLIKSEDFENSYELLSESLKSKLTVEKLEEVMTGDFYDSNPKLIPPQEYQMPYKKVAIEFASYLVDKEFVKAFNMLTKKQQEKYTPKLLERKMKNMTSYFDNPENIFVGKEFVLDEVTFYYDDSFIYVPIEEDGNSEAVYVELIKEDEVILIGNIEWGRP